MEDIQFLDAYDVIKRANPVKGSSYYTIWENGKPMGGFRRPLKFPSKEDALKELADLTDDEIAADGRVVKITVMHCVEDA